MSKSSKPSSAKSKKAYAAPKLKTHGDVRKLTQHPGPGKGPGPASNLFGPGKGPG